MKAKLVRESLDETPTKKTNESLNEHHKKTKKSQISFICKHDKKCKKADLEKMTDKEVEKKYLALEKRLGIRESLNEAARVPSNIREFAQRRGCLPLVSKVARWAESVGKYISGGTAIGKYYDTLVLDMQYHGAEIYINLDTDEIKLYGQIVTDLKSFRRVFEESN